MDIHKENGLELYEEHEVDNELLVESFREYAKSAYNYDDKNEIEKVMDDRTEHI